MAKDRAKKKASGKKPWPIVPKEYGGKWIAWSEDERKILGSGLTLEEARDTAIAAGEGDPVLEWVPPGPIIGFRR